MDARGKTESIRGFGESDESTTAREEEVREGGEEERGKGGRKEEIDRKERGIYHWVPLYIPKTLTIITFSIYNTNILSTYVSARISFSFTFLCFYLLLSFCMSIIGYECNFGLFAETRRRRYTRQNRMF